MLNTQTLTLRWLTALERTGNRLPAPAMLFVWLIVLVFLLSALAAAAGWQTQLATGDHYQARSLLSADGLRWLADNLVENFIGFAPVGTVLVTMLGLGIAEHSGLLRCLLLRLAASVRGPLLTWTVVLAGILSNIAFDVGYVLLIPLAGMLFYTAGRPPLAGFAAAFAGVSAGYSANLVLGPVDVILAGMTQEAVAIIDADYRVSVAGNYYFTVASTLILSLVGAWVSERWVEPWLARGSDEDKAFEVAPDSPSVSAAHERRGLWGVLGWTLLFALLLVCGASGDNAPLRNAEGRLLLNALVPVIALYAAVAGIIFGRLSGHYHRASEAVTGMENAMQTLASYLVLMFFASQFVACFGWSHLGVLVASSGAGLLSALEGQSILLLLMFILISAFINLFVGSASAKWGILAPVFVPMLFMLGVAPEQVQMAYRIGDSSTNIITPLMPYFGVVLAFAARYRHNMGVGTIMAMMLPYSVAFLLVWSAFFALWIGAGWPLGG